jgi:polar amino acid transport system substrate-binding protein
MNFDLFSWMNRTPRWIAAAMVACVVAAPAASQTLDEIKERGELVVGVKTDFPPFGSVDSSGKNIGFDVDLAHAFAEALFGDENAVEFVSVTSGNRIPFLQSEKIDIIMASMTITDERAEVVDFSEPYFLSGSLILTPENSEIQSVEDLNGKTVAVVQGSVQDTIVEELAPEADRVKFGKVSEAVLALKTGRADAYVHDDIVVLTLAQENPDLKPVGEPFRPLPYGVAVRKGDDAFSAWMDEQFARMREDGSFDALWDKHFGAIEENLIRP